LNDEPLREFQEEYARLRGRAFAPPKLNPVLFGHMPQVVKPFMRPALRNAANQARGVFPSIVPPVGKLAEAPSAPNPPSTVPPRSLVVLGMHRSGTSCLAGTLMECGVYFGEVSRKNRYNAKGNNENQQIMDLQDRLLADNGGSWKSPPQYVLWNDQHRRTRDEIVQQYRAAGQPLWGFKDPRTLLTLPGWTEALPNLQLIGIFRHPDAVAQSLTNRNLFSREDGLELWYQYNRRLLAAYQARPFPVIHFSAHDNEFRAQLWQLAQELNLAVPPGSFQFFDSGLRHCDPSQQRALPHAVDTLYRDLREISCATDAGVNRRKAA
jgi:hypothetical protein